MVRKNIVGIETKFGYRTIELYEGNLCKLDRSVDVLVLSALSGNYDPTPGSVVGAMLGELGLDVSFYRRDPDYDLTSALGIWISRPLSGYPFSRLLCAELLGTALAIPDVIDNVLVSLSILEAKGAAVANVALPVRGTTTHVSGLDPRDGEKFIASRCQLMEVDPALFTNSIVAELMKVTEGSPLYIEDVVRLTSIIAPREAIRF